MNFIQKAAAKLIFGASYEQYVRAWNSGDVIPQIDGTECIDSITAMKYSAVFACNRVLSETLAGMPIVEYRKNSKNGRDPTNDTAAYEVLHNRPNEEMAPFNYKEAAMTAINLGGNAVSERLVNKAGEIVGLYPYEWSKVQIERDKETNRLVYKIREGTKTKTLQRDQVFHIAGPSFNGVVGLSPIEYLASAIRLGLSYEQFGVQFYKNGANSSGAFKFPQAMSEPAFKRLKEGLKENYTGLLNTGTPMLLEEGGEFQPFTIKPADAQLIENKRFQKEDIASIYRVPLHLIQDLSRSTNNNIEHQSLEFVMYTMLPHFKRWEENANMQLLTPQERRAGYYLEFKLDALLRGDAKSRAEAYAAGRQWGWLSVNDIRKLENMPSILNGDIYLTPLNMYEAGKEAPQQQSKVNALSEEIFKMIKEGDR